MEKYLGIVPLWLLLSLAIFVALSVAFPYQQRVHMMISTDFGILIAEVLFSLGLAGAVVFSRANAAERDRDDYSRIYRILTDDERAALKMIRRTKSLSQDSLRFRLGWSKSKTSSIVTRLEKYGLIQRERIGKTYRLFPEDKK